MAIVWIILSQAALTYLCTGKLVNIGVHKPASMSSEYRGTDSNLPAENAVDGNTIAVLPSIIHTDANQTFAWWMVDLQTQVQDATVKIYFRTDYTVRRNGVKLYTSTNTIPYPPSGGTPCHTFINPVPDINSVNCPGSWRYLMVHTTTRTDGIILDFGEVEVLGCDRTYGQSCDKLCSSRHCIMPSTACDRYTGACLEGCTPGWKGTDCVDECSSNEYGRNCTNSCSSRHCEGQSTTCNRFNGSCSTEGCQAGWKGIDCKIECSSNEYGRNCANFCSSRHCEVPSTTCNRFNGSCSIERCQAGWMGIDCTKVCPSGKYGVNCMEKCGHCNGSCETVNGRCPWGCLPGFCGAQCQNKLADDASLDTDLDKLTVGVIGAVIGVIVAIVVGAVLHICLVRHGRLQWNKSEDSRQSAEMSDLRNPHGSSRTAADNPQSNTGDVYNNDYSVLDSTTKSETQVYDVLHDKDYQNV